MVNWIVIKRPALSEKRGELEVKRQNLKKSPTLAVLIHKNLNPRNPFIEMNFYNNISEGFFRKTPQ